MPILNFWRWGKGWCRWPTISNAGICGPSSFTQNPQWQAATQNWPKQSQAIEAIPWEIAKPTQLSTSMPTLPLPPSLLRAADFLPSIALSPAKEARCARDKERHYFGQAWVASKMPKLEPLSHFQQRSAWCKPTPYFILKLLCSAGPYVQPVISCDWFTSIF